MAIASLTVALKAQTASFASGLQRATQLAFKSGKDIERSLNVIAKAGVLAGAAMASATAAMVKGSLEAADKSYKLAQQAGISTEALTGLAYAAKLSGVEQEALATSLGKLNRSLVAAAKGEGESAEAFRSLGISVKDSSGKLKDADTILGEVADKFASFRDGPEKSALAMQIFGKAGAQLIPMLNDGKVGIQNLKDEAASLGLVLDDAGGKKAQAFNDSLERMDAMAKGAAMQFSVGLAGSLNDLLAAFVRVENGASTFRSVGEGVGRALKFAATMASGFQLAVETLHVKLEKLQAFDKNFRIKWTIPGRLGMLGKPTDLSDFDRQIEALEGQRAAFLNRLENATPGINKPGGKGDPPPVGKGKGIFTVPDSAPWGAYALEVNKAGEIVANTLVRMSDAYTQLFDVIPPKLKSLTEQIHELPAASKTDAFSKAIDAQTEAINDRNDALQRGAELTMQVRTAQEVYSDSVNEYLELLEQGVITQETFDRAVMKSAEALDKVNEHTRDFTRTIGQALEDAILRFESIRSVLAGLLQDIARILLRVTITKPFEEWLTGVFSKGGSKSSGPFNLPGVIKNLFGGFRAAGGPVVPGRAYMVGEKGPEMFAPASAGRIIPGGKGGGTVINNYIDARGADAGVEHRLMRALEAVEERAVKGAVAVMGHRQFRFG